MVCGCACLRLQITCYVKSDTFQAKMLATAKSAPRRSATISTPRRASQRLLWVVCSSGITAPADESAAAGLHPAQAMRPSACFVCAHATTHWLRCDVLAASHHETPCDMTYFILQPGMTCAFPGSDAWSGGPGGDACVVFGVCVYLCVQGAGPWWQRGWVGGEGGRSASSVQLSPYYSTQRSAVNDAAFLFQVAAIVCVFVVAAVAVAVVIYRKRSMRDRD